MMLCGLATRVLVGCVLCACTFWALAAPAVVGFIAPDEEPRYTNLLAGLRQGLQAAGAGDGNVTIEEHRIRRGDAAGARRAAQALQRSRARVAFIVGTELTKLVRSVTSDLPVVFITPGDPVRAGLAASLGHPGGNLTGLTFEFPELSAKRLALLKEIAPLARDVAVVYDVRDSSPRQGFAAMSDAAAQLGMRLVPVDAGALGGGLRDLGKLDGLVLVPGGGVGAAVEQAVRLARTHRIVSVAWARSEATRDAILTYGVTDLDVARSAAQLVARVLRGQHAGDMPIERPTKFQLVVNLGAARAIGLTVPVALLLRADEVIP